MKKFLGIIITGLVLLNMTACQMQQPAQPTGSEGYSSVADTGMEGTGTEDTGTEGIETEGTEMESATEPEEDSSEPAELPILEDDQIVRVMDYIPTIQQELRYATIDNFTGRIIYDFDDAYLRYGTIKKLAKACEKLAEYGLGIKIWDAFRPLEAQKALWEICPDPNYVSHPKTGTRSHCKGSAVDITLVDLKTGQEVAVPSGFDEFSALGDRDYSDCSEEAAKYAKLLEDIMKECGFKPYSKEWWHFSDTDSYEVEENFYPVIPELW